MAKSQSRSDQHGRIKVRVIELELEGSDDSLQEGLKSLAVALGRGGASVVARVKADASRQIGNGNVSAPVEEASEVEEIEAEAAEDNAPSPKPRAARKQVRVVQASILKDVRLDDVDPTFKDFAQAKAPTSDMARHLVVAYWFKTFKDIPDLSADHFYTAYRMAGWKVPRDCLQPARELRNSRVGKFSSGHEPGTFTINQIGENAVLDMGS